MLLSALVSGHWMVGLAVVLQLQTVTGTVIDPSGAVIRGASIVVHQQNQPASRTHADERGRFTITVAPGDVVLAVSAPRFVETRTSLPPGAPATDLVITLSPAGFTDTVTVTAGRISQRITELASTVSIVERAAIDRSPAMTIDDVLRQVPSFSLFRRSSSLAAHPTAQGVSLRGIGPSGVSRTLVLLDGMPFNDPFGGWVSWSRVPVASIGRIEVVEGSAANLFGNYALGGAINLLPREERESSLDGRLQYGERRTPRLDVSATAVRGRLTGAVDGSAFTTRGYTAVHPAERGAVDENVAARFGNVSARLRYLFDNGSSLSARAGLFDESRDNGKRSTVDGTAEANDTSWMFLNVAGRVHLTDRSQLHATVFSDRVRFASNFLAVPPASPARSIGRMTLDQSVPSSSVGATAQWFRELDRQVVTAGADWRAIEGESRENGLDALTGTRTVLRRISGGAQQQLGVFVQDVITPRPWLTFTLGVRHDRWRNSQGHNLETDASGMPTGNNQPSLPDRSDTVTAPRVSGLIRVNGALSLWASAGRGFRAPTLNELYRQFRVGSVLTLANEALGPERLRSIETGARYTPTTAMMIRATWFDNVMKDAVANVTVTTAGAAVTQQRQNVGLTRTRGVQTDIDWRPAARLTFSAAYIFNVAEVREFPANLQLVGKRLPQVPRHRGSAQVVISAPRLADFAVVVQAAGRQFDDDLNERRVPGANQAGLPGYTRVDVSLSRKVDRRIDVFVGAQNVLDRRVIVGTLPTTIGEPRSLSAGVRVHFDGLSRR